MIEDEQTEGLEEDDQSTAVIVAATNPVLAPKRRRLRR